MTTKQKQSYEHVFACGQATIPCTNLYKVRTYVSDLRKGVIIYITDVAIEATHTQNLGWNQCWNDFLMNACSKTRRRRRADGRTDSRTDGHIGCIGQAAGRAGWTGGRACCHPHRGSQGALPVPAPAAFLCQAVRQDTGTGSGDAATGPGSLHPSPQSLLVF